MARTIQRRKDFPWTEFWRTRTHLWIKIFSLYESKVCLRLFKRLDVKTCLELGGGPGYLAKLIAQNLGYTLTLLENDPEAYKLFRKISNYGNYIIKDFFEYKPRKKFDLVFSFGVIEHYPSRVKRIEAIRVHARLSNKYIAVFVPKNSFFVRHFFHYPEEKGFEKLYAPSELEKELKDAGLKTLKFAQNPHAIGFLCKVDQQAYTGNKF